MKVCSTILLEFKEEVRLILLGSIDLYGSVGDVRRPFFAVVQLDPKGL